MHKSSFHKRRVIKLIMESLGYNKLLLLIALVAVAASVLEANIADFDEVWQKRAEAARKAALDAYQPHPENVTNELNHRVHEDMESDDGTRRKLGKKTDNSCVATNPIDRCWRCDKNWARNRKKLADCVLGFGHKTTGGKDGRFYVVTDPSDEDMINPKPGTLRHAVIQTEPLWITFARNMVIRLSEELIVTDNKTIDGRGANVHISNGAQITIQFVRNVIVHNVHIHDHHPGNGGLIRDSVDHYGLRSRSDGDGISLFGATNVWIDHVSMSNCFDGLIDAVEGCTAITISNCHFTRHNEVMLFGASDSYAEDAVLQITVAFNHFGQGLIQRMPRVRWGFVHVVNNDYTHWLMYAIGGSTHPTIISQGNRFNAPPDLNCKEVTKRDYAPESEWKSWTWRSENDLMMNGAFFIQSGSPIRHAYKREMIKAKPGSSVTRLVRYAGALNCVEGKPC